jgi:gluconolactonase
MHIRVVDVRSDGRLSGGSVWAELTGEGQGGPDGMKIDSAGNLYCCGPGGVHVFAPDAHCLGVIRVPEVVANFTWGEDDMQSLFLTASGSLYRARVRTAGVPLF